MQDLAIPKAPFHQESQTHSKNLCVPSLVGSVSFLTLRLIYTYKFTEKDSISILRPLAHPIFPSYALIF
jgi:hypothetical protein